MSKLYKILKASGIIWEADSESEYHPLLTSGLHSDKYVNCTKLLEHYNLSIMMLRSFDYTKFNCIINEISAFCGLQTGGMGVLYLIPSVFCNASTVKLIHSDKEADHRITRWDINSFDKPIAIVDDVITTGSSITKMLNHYDSNLFYKDIICLFNRTGKDTITLAGKTFGIISAMNINATSWPEEECVLCKHGSDPIRPKVFWDKL